jgi:hypothetical protein
MAWIEIISLAGFALFFVAFGLGVFAANEKAHAKELQSLTDAIERIDIHD